MPIAEDMVTKAFFRASVTITVRNGSSTLFWTECLLNNQGIQEPPPELFVAMPARRRNSQTIQAALNSTAWLRDIVGPLMLPIILQYIRIRALVDVVVLSDQDSFRWNWTASGDFSARSTYVAMFVGEVGLHGAKVLWKVRAPPEYKFFMWLALNERCWTGDRLHRHSLFDDPACVLCLQHDEIIDRLLFGCVFSLQIWQSMFQKFGGEMLVPASHDDFASWWLRTRCRVPKLHRQAYDSLVLLVSRGI
jgi:hypothetical protein